MNGDMLLCGTDPDRSPRRQSGNQRRPTQRFPSRIKSLIRVWRSIVFDNVLDRHERLCQLGAKVMKLSPFAMLAVSAAVLFCSSGLWAGEGNSSTTTNTPNTQLEYRLKWN